MPQPPESGLARWLTVAAEATIHAPRQQVWDVLTGFPAYNDWNPFTYDLQLERFEVGATLHFTVRMRDDWLRPTDEIIREIRPDELIAWGYPNEGLFTRARRYQVLRSIDETTTHYSTWETFYGLTGPLVVLLYRDDLQRGFEDVATGLKQYTEQRDKRK
jgi:hypothetical protein